MVQDAEQNAAADKEKSEQIDIKNQSEALCYQTKKQLEQLEATCTPEEKQKIENLVSELEEAVKTDNFNSMKELSESLKKAVMEVGEKAYSSAGNAEQGNDDVIETDFSAEK
jgi:molecular chaperone DnaK